MPASTCCTASSAQFYATDPRIARCAPAIPTGRPGQRDLHQPERAASRPMRRTSPSTSARNTTFDLGGGDTLTPRRQFRPRRAAMGDAVRKSGARRPAGRAQHPGRAARLDARQLDGHRLTRTNLTNQHYVGALNSGLDFAGPPRQYGDQGAEDLLIADRRPPALRLARRPALAPSCFEVCPCNPMR